MHGTTAKGSNKNRIYQFWLIRFFKEKRKRRKVEKMLKKRRIEEDKKKRLRNYFFNSPFKLSTSPIYCPKKILLQKETKKRTISQLVTQRKKETQKFIGDLNQKKIYKDEIPFSEKGNLPKKKPLEQITFLNSNLKTSKKTLEKNNGFRKKVNIRTMKKSELKKNQTVKKKGFNPNDFTLKECFSLYNNKNIQDKTEKKLSVNTVKTDHSKEQISKIIQEKISEPKQQSEKATIVPFITIAGVSIMIFPSLQTVLKFKKEKNEEGIEKNKEGIEKNKEGIEKNKETIEPKIKIQKPKKTNQEPQIKQVPKKNKKSLKLYRFKLNQKREDDILIKAELERQQGYLKDLYYKLGQMDHKTRIEYHFRGISQLIGNIFNFTLGLFLLPISKNNIVKTALGVVLIQNSLKGIRNGFKKSQVGISYQQWRDFSKTIMDQSASLEKLNTMIIDSLEQIKGIRSDMESEFQENVDLEEYKMVQGKLNIIEQSFVEKQKQIEEMQMKLQKAEEKNKVKVKRLDF